MLTLRSVRSFSESHAVVTAEAVANAVNTAFGFFLFLGGCYELCEAVVCYS